MHDIMDDASSEPLSVMLEYQLRTLSMAQNKNKH